MGNIQIATRTFVIKVGMTPQDVINSKYATAQQKKAAHIFDSDGVKGYSQREANVFNATTITDRGEKGISLWTRYKNGSKKETKVSNLTNYKYAPKGDIKPYTFAKKKADRVKTSKPSIVEENEILVFSSKEDSISYAKIGKQFSNAKHQVVRDAKHKIARISEEAEETWQKADKEEKQALSKGDLKGAKAAKSKKERIRETEDYEYEAILQKKKFKEDELEQSEKSTKKIARKALGVKVKPYKPEH